MLARAASKKRDDMERTDEQLLLACRAGDEGAWEALLRRYQRLIYTVPRRAGLDEDAASEIFQEVFTTLLENIDSIEQPSRLQAWLVTTARRKTWRHVRRAGSTRPFGGDDETADAEVYAVADAQPLPDEVIERLEQQHLVRRGLAQLDERCRKLLTLLFYSPEPPPYSEIAAAINAPEGSVGPTRARCLRKLLTILEKAGI